LRERNSHIFDKEQRGHYVEPAWVSRRLFEVERFYGEIYDPACGWGTILKAATDRGLDVIGSDIVDRRRHHLGKKFFKNDFLKNQPAAGVAGSIICNPPFDHVEEFCRSAVATGAPKVAMICLTRRLNAAHWLQALPLKRIWLLTPRPSMPPGAWITAGNKPGGGTQDFCWLVFARGFSGELTVRWLHRDGAKVK
jgi:hypothetical protein